MEAHGIYFAPYKRGRGVLTEKIKKIKKKHQTDVKNAKGCNYNAKGCNYNVQLQQLVKHIPYFRNIF